MGLFVLVKRQAILMTGKQLLLTFWHRARKLLMPFDRRLWHRVTNTRRVFCHRADSAFLCGLLSGRTGGKVPVYFYAQAVSYMGQTIIKMPKRGKKRRRQMECYADRDFELKALGYTSYPEYLKSSDWAKIRGEILENSPKCFLCDRDATQVHHLDYSPRTLLGLCRQLLVSLCNACHERIEFDGKEKRTLFHANGYLFTLACAIGHGRWMRKTLKLLKITALERNNSARNTDPIPTWAISHSQRYYFVKVEKRRRRVAADPIGERRRKIS